MCLRPPSARPSVRPAIARLSGRCRRSHARRSSRGCCRSRPISRRSSANDCNRPWRKVDALRAQSAFEVLNRDLIVRRERLDVLEARDIDQDSTGNHRRDRRDIRLAQAEVAAPLLGFEAVVEWLSGPCVMCPSPSIWVATLSFMKNGVAVPGSPAGVAALRRATSWRSQEAASELVQRRPAQSNLECGMVWGLSPT